VTERHERIKRFHERRPGRGGSIDVVAGGDAEARVDMRHVAPVVLVVRHVLRVPVTLPDLQQRRHSTSCVTRTVLMSIVIDRTPHFLSVFNLNFAERLFF
jgi:hypothetical protein